jgi:hypothetical protein
LPWFILMHSAIPKGETLRKKIEHLGGSPVSEFGESSAKPRNWLDGRIRDLAVQISDGGPASSISRVVADIRLGSIDRVLHLQADMEQGRNLEAAGHPSGRGKARSAWLALREESDGALLLDRLLRGLCHDLNLNSRCRLEEIGKMTSPTVEKSAEEQQAELLADIFLMITSKACVFPLPLPLEVKEAAAKLGVKLAIEATEKCDDTGS